jgi:hypothetical protein
MRELRHALAGPGGPALAGVLLILGLLAIPGAEEAILLGSAAAHLFDLVVLMIAIITALGSRRWWHTCAGGILASLWVALRPRSEYFTSEPSWLHGLTIGAAFLSIAFVTGLAVAIRAAIPRRTPKQPRP